MKGFFNIITLVFLALTLCVFLAVLGMIAKVIQPPAAWQPKAVFLPTVFLSPTSPPPTSTETPSLTFTPSRTSTPSRTPSPTLTPSGTSTPTDTPTSTPMPSNTLPPSKTLTNTPTATATKIPPPTKPPTRTRPPTRTVPPTASGPTATKAGQLPFKVQAGTPVLTPNTDAVTACAFQGIRGLVYDMNGNPLAGLQIAVTNDSGFNQNTVTGSNPALFGQGGWQVQLGTAPNNLTYSVELRSNEGVPLSDKVKVTFPNSCDKNLALVNFAQTRPF